jgi:hypothetical protein
MQNKVLFQTTTTMGNDHVMLLLFPPTDCLKSNSTLGNQTGRELAQNGLKSENTSVVECYIEEILKTDSTTGEMGITDWFYLPQRWVTQTTTH